MVFGRRSNPRLPSLSKQLYTLVNETNIIPAKYRVSVPGNLLSQRETVAADGVSLITSSQRSQ